MGFFRESRHKEADRESLALEPNRAKIYVWLFYELSGLLRSYPRVERRSVSLRLALIAHPSTRDFIKEKKDLIEIFCNSFLKSRHRNAAPNGFSQLSIILTITKIM